MSDQGANKAVVPREEFEQFLLAFTHEIRNRLNGIALEATDLAEQAGDLADATRLQQQIQDCSTLLKTVREALASDNPQAERVALADFTKTWRKGRE